LVIHDFVNKKTDLKYYSLPISANPVLLMPFNEPSLRNRNPTLQPPYNYFLTTARVFPSHSKSSHPWLEVDKIQPVLDPLPATHPVILASLTPARPQPRGWK